MHQLLNRTFKTVALLGALAMVGAAQAGPTPTLKSVSGGLGVLDTSTGLEWLQDWNMAGKIMILSEAYTWIAKLNTEKYAGHSDWRLPNSDTCEGFHCTGSEMGHLFYNALGGKAYESILKQGGDNADEKANFALFKNVQSGVYWSGTEYAPGSKIVMHFGMDVGYQAYVVKDYPMYALAVRSGDVTAAVPEPQTLALTLIALTGALLARRRRAL